MQEDFKKKFVLLSKVAKEKKYAQEYLGLLARRGDIGSIRIGKRWFTTWEWFSEFLENSSKKKTESLEKEPISLAEQKVELKVVTAEDKVENKNYSINLGSNMLPEKEVAVFLKKENMTLKPKVQFPEKSSFSVKINIPKPRAIAPVRHNPTSAFAEKKSPAYFERIQAQPVQPKPMEIRRDPSLRRIANPSSISRNETFRERGGVFSPNMFAVENEKKSFFPGFAFASGFVLFFLLVAVSGYVFFSMDILRSGKVAGARDERNGNFSGIISESDRYFAYAGDEVRESISLSRVLIEAAREKEAIREK